MRISFKSDFKNLFSTALPKEPVPRAINNVLLYFIVIVLIFKNESRYLSFATLKTYTNFQYVCDRPRWLCYLLLSLSLLLEER